MQALPGSLASLDLGSCGVEAEGAASLAAALAQSASVNTRPPGNDKAAAAFLTGVFCFFRCVAGTHSPRALGQRHRGRRYEILAENWRYFGQISPILGIFADVLGIFEESFGRGGRAGAAAGGRPLRAHPAGAERQRHRRQRRDAAALGLLRNRRRLPSAQPGPQRGQRILAVKMWRIVANCSEFLRIWAILTGRIGVF